MSVPSNFSDSETQTLVTNRRRLLKGLLAGALALGTTTTGLIAASQDGKSLDGLSNFSKVSTLLTQDQNLSSIATNRLYEALMKSDSNLDQQLTELLTAIPSGKLTPQQTSLALTILEGWYLGTVNNQVILYEEALMFKVVHNAINERLIRSYVPDAPDFWQAKPKLATDTKATIVSGEV